MKWFVAKIIYRIISGNGAHMAQFDEQLRIINAGNKQQAWLQAKAIGIAEQDSFLNMKKQTVQWKFIDVCEVYELAAIAHGTELYSRIEEKENALLYEDMVHAKAAQLANELNTSNLQHIN